MASLSHARESAAGVDPEHGIHGYADSSVQHAWCVISQTTVTLHFVRILLLTTFDSLPTYLEHL